MLGESIKKVRKAKRISINKLASLSGVALGYLSDIENNKKSNLGMDKLQKIADALGVPVSSFFDDEIIDDYLISEQLVNLMSEAIGVELRNFFKQTGKFVIYDEKTNKVEKLIPMLEKHFWESIKSYPKSVTQLAKGNSINFHDIVQCIIYDAENKIIKIDIKYPDECNNPADKYDRIESMAIGLDILDIDFKNSLYHHTSIDPSSYAAESTVSYDSVYQNLKAIPVLGVIRAGEPIRAEQNIIGHEFIPANMLNGGEYFGLKVTGDSMNASRINDGDIVIVREQPTVENGEIAIVMVDGENATVKLFYQTATTITLIPQSTNPIHTPRVIDITKETVKVLGKVVKVIISL